MSGALSLNDHRISRENRQLIVSAVDKSDDDLREAAFNIVDDLRTNGVVLDSEVVISLMMQARAMSATRHAIAVRKNGGNVHPHPAKVDPLDKLAERTWHLPDDWLVNAPLPRPYVIRPYIPRRAVSALIGAGTSSKTMLVVEWAAAITTGNDWRGHTTQEGDVVICSWEDEGPDYHAKLHSLLHAREDLMLSADLIRKRLHIINMRDPKYKLVADGGGHPAATPLAHNIVAFLQRDYPDTAHVFIETVSRANGTDETNEAFAAVVTAGEVIACDLDCGVTAVHHVSKAALTNGVIDATAGRGGSSLADNCRATTVMMMITANSDKSTWPPGFTESDFKEREIVLIENARSSYARTAQRMHLERVYPEHGAPFLRAINTPSREDGPKRDVDAEMLCTWLQQNLVRKGMTERAITDQRKEYGLSERMARAALARLVASGALVERQGKQYGQTGKAVTLFHFPADVADTV